MEILQKIFIQAEKSFRFAMSAGKTHLREKSCRIGGKKIRGLCTMPLPLFLFVLLKAREEQEQDKEKEGLPEIPSAISARARFHPSPGRRPGFLFPAPEFSEHFLQIMKSRAFNHCEY